MWLKSQTQTQACEGDLLRRLIAELTDYHIAPTVSLFVVPETDWRILLEGVRATRHGQAVRLVRRVRDPEERHIINVEVHARAVSLENKRQGTGFRVPKYQQSRKYRSYEQSRNDNANSQFECSCHFFDETLCVMPPNGQLRHSRRKRTWSAMMM